MTNVSSKLPSKKIVVVVAVALVGGTVNIHERKNIGMKRKERK